MNRNYEMTSFDQECYLVCDNCHIEAQTTYVVFHRNIGLLYARHHETIAGNLCKSCINKYFWKYTPVTLVLGWWGVISFFATLFYIPNNIIQYI